MRVNQVCEKWLKIAGGSKADFYFAQKAGDNFWGEISMQISGGCKGFQVDKWTLWRFINFQFVLAPDQETG